MRRLKKPWPWKVKDPKKVKKWKSLYIDTIIRVFFNAGILVPVVQLGSLYLKNWEIPYKMDVEDLPDLKEFAWQWIFCLITDDIVFSLTHRLLHTPFLMRHVHYIHHRHHETVGLAATYSHPSVIHIQNSGLGQFSQCFRLRTAFSF